MCGFAAIIDLTGLQTPERTLVERMAEAIRHRGPDEQGFLSDRGFVAAHRRLSIIGLENGSQPIWNEDKSIAVICNGELFDFVEQRELLERRGHVFGTQSDTEVIVHLYEDHGEAFLDHLNGQFAFLLYDMRKRRLILARDRFGICPLHVARRGHLLYVGSEIKAMLASGAVTPEVDPLGVDHIFTFFTTARRRTMFAGIETVLPGTTLRIDLPNSNGRKSAEVIERRYWDFEFPDRGEEDNPSDENALLDEFEATFRRAVDVRLRADVPVAGYLSGGIDSAAVVSQAASVLNRPIPTFTVQVPTPGLDESGTAMVASRHIGTMPNVVQADPKLISNLYPALVSAADCPVVDTSCAALLALSNAVRESGHKVVLTGEGSDEALAGYVWFKIQNIALKFGLGSQTPGMHASRLMRKALIPSMSLSEIAANDRRMGGIKAQSDMYHLVSTSRRGFYSDAMFERLAGRSAYDDIEIDGDRIRRWHPLNQSLYIGYKIFLAGLLLNHKGDRVTMANSVEARYPFLDENVVRLTSRLAPRWKIRGWNFDKYLLRRTAARWLPHEIAMRPKRMFRAPFVESFLVDAPAYVEQLLSEESLQHTGYFDPAKVRRVYGQARSGRLRPWQFFSSMGLASVLATQLWHHQNLGGGLCELPSRSTENAAPERPLAAE